MAEYRLFPAISRSTPYCKTLLCIHIWGTDPLLSLTHWVPRCTFPYYAYSVVGCHVVCFHTTVIVFLKACSSFIYKTKQNFIWFLNNDSFTEQFCKSIHWSKMIFLSSIWERFWNIVFPGMLKWSRLPIDK